MKNPETVRAAGVDRNSLQHFNINYRRGIINQDAKILQYLKSECQKNGTGAKTLQQVFTGLLSVHNKHLLELADALERTGDNE